MGRRTILSSGGELLRGVGSSNAAIERGGTAHCSGPCGKPPIRDRATEVGRKLRLVGSCCWSRLGNDQGRDTECRPRKGALEEGVWTGGRTSGPSFLKTIGNLGAADSCQWSDIWKRCGGLWRRRGASVMCDCDISLLCRIW